MSLRNVRSFPAWLLVVCTLIPCRALCQLSITSPGDVYVSDATGTDTNPGTADAPVKTIAIGILIASPDRVVRVAQGAYSEKVTMVEGVSLLGGHQCSLQSCTWARDPVLYDTAIVNQDFEGVLAPNTITRATRLDGFRVVGKSGTPSAAPGSVAITLRGGTPTLYGNRVFGGDVSGASFLTNQSAGIAIVAPSNAAQGSLIDGNQVTGGGAASTTAAILFDAGSQPGSSSAAVIINNTIHGGQSQRTSYGIAGWAASSGTLVKANEILAGTSTGVGISGESWAIVFGSTMTIDSNRINVDQPNVGTCAGTRWCGGILSSSGTAVITNNIVFGAKAGRSAALLLGEFEVAAGTIVLNANYLDGGGTGLTVDPTFSTAVVLQLGTCNQCGSNTIIGRIRNNILVGGQNQNRYGVYEDAPGGRAIHPEAFDNNDFHFAALPGRSDILYRFWNTSTATNITNVAALPVAWVGNFAADPAVDSSFHLTVGSPCVDAGTGTEAPSVDFEGDVRPQGAAVDVGADELKQAPGPATTLSVAAPANAVGGSSFNVTVTARDTNANTATGYRGTVHFTSNDTAATLPADYTFTAADNGVHTFAVTLNTAGSMTLAATDSGASSVAGNATVTVSGNATTTILTTSVNPSAVGQSVTFTATVTSSTIGAITGMVTLKDGTTTIGIRTLGNPATFTTSTLSEGSHSISAIYGGSTNFNASTSPVLTQTVYLTPFGPPPFLSATATSTAQVALSWAPVRGATSYELYRSSSMNGPYNLVPTTANTSTVDSGRAADTTYLYKVRAIGASGPSDYSGIEPATTTVFVDAVLAGVPMKAIHVTQLRTAVNAMRTAAELTAVTFAEPSLGGAIVKRVHLTDLRTSLDEARNALGIPAITYTDPVITPGVSTVKAAHWLEVRAGTQ